MAKSGHGSSPPPPGTRTAPVSSRLSPVAAIGAEAQRAAKELVVDDFVDTYLRERPKTRNPYDPGASVPTTPAVADAPPPPRATEESGIRVAIPHVLREEVRRPTVEVEAVAVSGAAGDVVALEAELADREERISTLEEELKRLRDSVTDEIGRTAAASGSAVARAAEPMAVPAPTPVPVPAPVAAPVPVPVAAPAPEPVPQPVPVPVAVGAPPRRTSTARRVLGGFLLAGAVAAVAAGVVGVGAERTPSLDATSLVAPEEPARTATAELPGRAAPAPPSTESHADAAAPVAPPKAAEPDVPPAQPDVPAEPEDAPGLLSFQGHLTVRSAADAEVVVQGQPIGRTNERLLARCGPRNVRLRDAGEWITPGQHVRIACMKHTTVQIDRR